MRGKETGCVTGLGKFVTDLLKHENHARGCVIDLGADRRARRDTGEIPPLGSVPGLPSRDATRSEHAGLDANAHMMVGVSARRRGRASALATLALALGSGVLAVRAHAHVEQRLLELGASVMQYAAADHQSAPARLELNGAAVRLSHGAVETSVSAALDHFAAECRLGAFSLGQEWARLEREHPQSVFRRPALLDGVFRAETDAAGVVACFAPSSPAGAHSVLERLQAVLATGDLAQLGSLRYARVERGQGRSVFLAIWSEGPLNIARMFPARGDAPGADPDFAPRPAGSRRLLSVRPSGGAQSLGMFATTPGAGVAQLTASYRAQLQRAGFRMLAPGPESPQGASLVASDGRRMLTVSFARDHGGAGVATVISSPEGNRD